MSEKEPTYDESQIAERSDRTLPGWYYEGGWIRRNYKTDGWPTTLMLVNTIGYCRGSGVPSSRSRGDLCARDRASCQTHSAGGITDKDFELARRIEDVVLWRPAQGGALRRDAEQVRAERRPACSTGLGTSCRLSTDAGESAVEPAESVAGAVRHGPARRAGACGACSREMAPPVRVRRRRARNHRRGADDDGVDRAPSRAARTAPDDSTSC